MAQRRCLHILTRQAIAVLSSNPKSLHHHTLKSLVYSSSSSSLIFTNTTSQPLWSHHNRRYFSSNSGSESENNEEDEETVADDSDDDVALDPDLKKEYSPQEKEEEAAAIGYKVIRQLGKNEQFIKPHKPIFAVVQIGSHQFKVSNGDSIFTERLKFCEVNDKLILNKVLLLGSRTQTIVGRPMVPDAVVQAVVEEHALDAKVIIFKKKRRKNYRRTKGHRQELTKLRIADIHGIEEPEMKLDRKPKKATVKKQEKVPVAT